MSQQVLDDFLRDVGLINRQFNLSRSSLRHLVAALRARIRQRDWSAITMADALRLTGNPTDGRLTKYRGAIQTLCDTWGLQQNPAVAVQARAVAAVIPPPAPGPPPTPPLVSGVGPGRAAAARTTGGFHPPLLPVNRGVPPPPRNAAFTPPLLPVSRTPAQPPPPVTRMAPPPPPVTFTPPLVAVNLPPPLPLRPPGPPVPAFVPVHQVPSAVRAPSVDATINAGLQTLTVYGGYAAGDAVRFNGTSEAIDRCKKMQADTKRTDPMKQAEQAAGGKEQYAQRTLAAVRQKIEEAQAGICTTFACAVADVLTEGTRQNPRSARVEIFATQRGLGTHLYVVVGRELGSVRDNPSTWGSQCRVVDCWAMAMGWATGPVQDPHHWPSNYWMLKKVASHYDSLKPDPDPNALAARGLERLVTAEQTQAERRRVQQSQATAPPEGVGKVPCPKCGLQFAQALLKNHMAKCTGSS